MKGLKVLTMTCLAFSLVVFGKEKLQRAPVNPDYLKYLEHKKSGENNKYTEDGHFLGYIPSPLKYNTEIPEKYNNSKLKSITAFPERYDLRELGYSTGAKDQGDLGACWTFGSVAALESNWILNGYGTFDLSEENMSTCHGYVWTKDEGGNFQIASNYLNNFMGPLLEKDDEYTTNPLLNLCKTFNATPTKYVPEARFIGGTPDKIKNAIMKYGGVAAGIKMGNYQVYYNNTDYTYYYYTDNYRDFEDHGIVIVGWDDNKVVTGGTASPEGTHKGAWIIKNSWGTNWGDKGYAYVSYDDSRMARMAAYWPYAVERSEIDKVFGYDELGAVTALGFGNDSAFALVKYSATGKTYINKIGTFIISAGTTIDIEVYGGKNDNNLTNLISSEYGIEFFEAGYFLIDHAAIVEGDFYIKIRYHCPDYFYLDHSTQYLVPVEAYDSGYADPVIEKNVCWISSTGEEWDPLGNDQEYGEFDICIRAYGTAASAPHAFFKADKKEVCKGSSVTFTEMSIENITAYNWDFGSGATPSTANTAGPHTVVYSSSGKKSVKLSVTSASGSDEITRKDYINVVDDIFVLTYDEIVITREDVPIEIKAYGADSYTWSPATYLDKTSGNSVIANIPEDSMVYTVTGTQGACSDEAKVTVYAVPGPVNDDVCNAIEVTLGVNGPYTNLFASVQYNEPFPTLGECLDQMVWCDEYGNTDPLRESPLDNTVWFYFIAPESGKASFRTDSVDLAIALYDAATCEDILDGNYTVVGANDDYIDEEPYWAAIDLISTLTPNKKYWIQIDGSGGGKYGRFNIIIYQSPLGIEENQVNSNSLFSVFPNPSNGIINIEYKGTKDNSFDIYIYNTEGKLVHSETQTILPNHSSKLDIKNLSKGFYLIKLETEKEKEDYKILIQ